MDDRMVIEKFKIPAEAYDVIPSILTEDERHFIARIDRETFTASDAARVSPKEISVSEAEEFLQKGYKRGVFNLVNEEKKQYSLNSFYGRLDVFAISELDGYRALTEEQKNKLDSWYFEEYASSLDSDPGVRPTSDEVLPLNEVLEFIDKQDRTIYLNPCDCRALAGKCHKPVLTCITYKNGWNTFSHRGHSKTITKEEAKEIVIHADKAGLMHTVNPNGICNCCGDCCYLFRAGSRRNSTGFWPKAGYMIETYPEKCIGCGKCKKTCHFGVFSFENGLSADRSKCAGCGICVGKCPKGALALIPR